MKKLLAALLFVLVSGAVHVQSQENDNLFSRLQAISNQGVDFFNVDGVEITSQQINSGFSRQGIAKRFRKFSIRESDLQVSDSTIFTRNYFVSKSEAIEPGTVQYSDYYFIENGRGEITAITFAGYNGNDREFERNFVKLILVQKIPRSVFASVRVDSINFAGRWIRLGGGCNWMGVNNMQCPGYGQMNWSVHQTLAGATEGVVNQYNQIKRKRGGKIVSEDTVGVVFEGTWVKAKRAVYDFKGVKSLLVGMSGGKTLTIYFVAAPVRQHFVSCVMSFWNNDRINPSGLPALLEEVMKLDR